MNCKPKDTECCNDKDAAQAMGTEWGWKDKATNTCTKIEAGSCRDADKVGAKYTTKTVRTSDKDITCKDLGKTQCRDDKGLAKEFALAFKWKAADDATCADLPKTDCRKADFTSQAMGAKFAYKAKDDATCADLAKGKCRGSDNVAKDGTATSDKDGACKAEEKKDEKKNANLYAFAVLAAL